MCAAVGTVDPNGDDDAGVPECEYSALRKVRQHRVGDALEAGFEPSNRRQTLVAPGFRVGCRAGWGRIAILREIRVNGLPGDKIVMELIYVYIVVGQPIAGL